MSPRDRPRVAACRGRASPPIGSSTCRPPSTPARFDASAEHRAGLSRGDGPALFTGADGPVILAVAAMREVKKLDAVPAAGQRPRDAPRRGPIVRGDSRWSATGRPGRRSRAALAPLPAGRVAFLGSLEPGGCPLRISAPTSSPSPAASTSSTCRPPPPACLSSRARGPSRTRWSRRTVRSSPRRRQTPSPRASPVSSTTRFSGTRWALPARRFVAADRTLEAFQRRLAAGLAVLGLPCARSTSR